MTPQIQWRLLVALNSDLVILIQREGRTYFYSTSCSTGISQFINIFCFSRLFYLLDRIYLYFLSLSPVATLCLPSVNVLQTLDISNLNLMIFLSCSTKCHFRTLWCLKCFSINWLIPHWRTVRMFLPEIQLIFPCRHRPSRSHPSHPARPATPGHSNQLSLSW